MGARCRLVWWLGLAVVSLGAAHEDTRLADAIKGQNTAVVSGLLKERVDVNAPLPDGTTALHWAVQWDERETVDQLIRAGANVNATSRYGVTPLALACTYGNAAIVEKLLQAGADPNASPKGEPPLMVAARSGDVGTVSLLLAHGANVNAKETLRGQTALMWAVAEANPGVAKVLIEKGADVHARSAGGFTPLLFGARKGDIASVRTLLAAGADPNEKAPDENESPLVFVAILNAHYELAALLLEHGADPNAIEKAERSVLHTLIAARNYPKFQYIGPPMQTGTLSTTGLIHALLTGGANPNARIQTGAALSTVPPNVKVAAIDAVVNLEGATPFFLAAQTADVAAMRILAAAGADPRLPTVENSTPLMVAAGLGFSRLMGLNRGPAAALEAVRLALEVGGDVNAANVHGQTALHGAVYAGVDEVIQFLVAQGAQLDAKDALGRTPAALAEVLTAEAAYQGGRDSALALLRKVAGERVTR